MQDAHFSQASNCRIQIKKWLLIPLLLSTASMALEVDKARDNHNRALRDKTPMLQQVSLDHSGFDDALIKPSPHPNIVTFRLPAALSEPLLPIMTKRKFDTLSAVQVAAVMATVEKCGNLKSLPAMLERMELDEVSLNIGTELANICHGYEHQWVAHVVSALRELAEQGSIPAILSLLRALDPGNPGIRQRYESLGQNVPVSDSDLYFRVNQLAYQSLSQGNLFYAKHIIDTLIMHGSPIGFSARFNPGDSVDAQRQRLIRAVALSEALWAIGAQPDRANKHTFVLQQLSTTERTEAQRQAAALVAGWQEQTILYNSDIRVQGYWRPGLF